MHDITLFYGEFDFLAHSVMREGVDVAFAITLGFDPAALRYYCDLLVGCHVTQGRRVALRHKLLFLVYFIDPGLDPERLAILESQFAFLECKRA